MAGLIKSEFYRLIKSKYILAAFLIIFFMAGFNIFLLKSDIKLGISIFGDGDITTIKNFNDLIFLGLNFKKGLGLIIALIISLFIGQEYNYKTLKLKIVSNNSREKIFLSKLIMSIIIAIVIFSMYQILIFSFASIFGIINITENNLEIKYISSLFIYIAIASITYFICLICRNNVLSIILTTFYILFNNTLYSVFQMLNSRGIKFLEVPLRYSLSSQSNLINSNVNNIEYMKNIFICFIIFFLVGFCGMILFKKAECE